MSFASELGKSLEELLEDSKKRFEKFTKEAYEHEMFYRVRGQEDAKREFAQVVQNTLRKIYYDSVQSFYDDYDPKYYRRKYSLYLLLAYPTDKYGRVDLSDYWAWFDESKMTKGRNGVSLFDLVFVDGWHGGMQFLGLPGVQSNPSIADSVFDEFTRRLAGDLHARYVEICSRHDQLALEKHNRRLPAIAAKYGFA